MSKEPKEWRTKKHAIEHIRRMIFHSNRSFGLPLITPGELAALRTALRALQRANHIDARMAELLPGKHFLGLWIYRQKNHRKVTPLWTCTLWDKDGDYVETPLRKKPSAALRDVQWSIWGDPSGAEGRGKGKRK